MASGETLYEWLVPANQPPAANYATLAARNTHPVLEYDDTTTEGAQFAGTMPANYAGGNIAVTLKWMAKTATTGNIGWIVAFENDSAGQDLDSDGYAADQTVAGVAVPGTSGVVGESSLTVTAGAATDAIAAGDLFRLRVQRDVATSGDATGDAQLLSVLLSEA